MSSAKTRVGLETSLCSQGKMGGGLISGGAGFDSGTLYHMSLGGSGYDFGARKSSLSSLKV